ncbi:MAG: trypsin-like peptidase domain-containing protein [Clostridia bacterium]|nr:trypsin-like peptidase domain-containing protein [Clostridia bacterium]
MKCRNCGYEIPTGVNVCPACGADQTVLAEKAETRAAKAKPAAAQRPAPAPKKEPPAVAKFFGAMKDDSLYKYALAVYNGSGVPKDVEIARYAFEELAKRGDTNAMYMFAQITLDDPRPDVKTAVYWLKTAAANGNVPANNKINYLLDQGLVTEDDLKFVDVGAIAGAQESGAKVFDMNKFSTVDLFYMGASKGWSGSGYIISDDGYFLTNAHVVTDASGNAVESLTAKVDGYSIRADVISVGDYSPLNPNGVDLALCKLSSMQGEMHPVTFADASTAHNGDTVYIIGNSLGDGSCITKGIISDRNRKLGGRTMIMTDCAINGGNSGSPLLNSAGQVIGTMCCHRMSSAGGDDAVQGMNYAVPNGTAIEFLEGCNRKVGVHMVSGDAPEGKTKTI